MRVCSVVLAYISTSAAGESRESLLVSRGAEGSQFVGDVHIAGWRLYQNVVAQISSLAALVRRVDAGPMRGGLRIRLCHQNVQTKRLQKMCAKCTYMLCLKAFAGAVNLCPKLHHYCRSI
jgi:hypothetical protein